MMKSVYALAAGALLATPVLCLAQPAAFPTTTDSDSATSPSPHMILDTSRKKPTDYWNNAVARFKSMETTAPRHATVIIGDSITNRWPVSLFPAEVVVNRGIGSDHIGGWTFYGLLDRLDTSIRVLEPRRIFLMIGINDMLKGGPPMENMVPSYGYLLDQMHAAAPNAEIIVQSILPVCKPDFAYMHDPIIEMNRHIKKLAADRGLKYVDLYSEFADDKGLLKQEYSRDGVHLSEAGYKKWREVLIREGLGTATASADSSATTSTAGNH